MGRLVISAREVRLVQVGAAAEVDLSHCAGIAIDPDERERVIAAKVQPALASASAKQTDDVLAMRRGKP